MLYRMLRASRVFVAARTLLLHHTTHARKIATVAVCCAIPLIAAESRRKQALENDATSDWYTIADADVACGSTSVDGARRNAPQNSVIQLLGVPGKAGGFDPDEDRPDRSNPVWDDSLNRVVDDVFGTPSSSSSASSSPHRQNGAEGRGKRGYEDDVQVRTRVFMERTGSLPNQAGLSTVGSLLLANTLVFLGWKIPMPSVRAFMERNFLTSPAHMAVRGMPWGWATCLWSAYSHSSFLHFAANMLAFTSFGAGLMDERSHSVATPTISPLSFVGMYNAAGFLGSVGSNLFSAACGSSRPALGASGAVFAIVTYHSLSRPDSGVALLFFIHTDAATAMVVATAINIGLSASQWRSARKGLLGPSIDGTAHLVGTAIGALWWYGSSAYAKASGAPAQPRRRAVPRAVPGHAEHGQSHAFPAPKLKHPPPGAVDI